MTGFALVLDASGTFSKSAQVSGECYAADYAVPTPAKMTAAIGDMEYAYADAASRTSEADKKNVGGGTIGGMTLQAGVYTWTVNVQFATDLTLVGGPTDVFILQTTGNVFAGAGVRIILAGGIPARNVFWQVAGNVAIGANAHVEGIFLCKTDVTFVTGASITGRLFAQTAVNLQKAVVTEPAPLTLAPTPAPTAKPTFVPSPVPTSKPTAMPSFSPTSAPTVPAVDAPMVPGADVPTVPGTPSVGAGGANGGAGGAEASVDTPAVSAP